MYKKFSIKITQLPYCYNHSVKKHSVLNKEENHVTSPVNSDVSGIIGRTFTIGATH